MTRLSRSLAAALGALVSVVAIATAQTARPQVELGPYRPNASIDGKENFEAYCAVCHGRDGKGGGPAAAAMKAPVPDLTTLAARSGGRFDRPRTEYVIRGTGKTPTPAHGTQEMPIWGQVFDPNLWNREITTLRVDNLVKYLESIQVKGSR
jgi:mono/diheme cytochrome c family protein